MNGPPTQAELKEIERCVRWSEKHKDEWVCLSTELGRRVLDAVHAEGEARSRSEQQLQAELEAVRGMLHHAERMLFEEREAAKRRKDLIQVSREQVMAIPK